MCLCIMIVSWAGSLRAELNPAASAAGRDRAGPGQQVNYQVDNRSYCYLDLSIANDIEMS